MTLREAQTFCRGLGYTLKHQDGEYIVKPRGFDDDAGYFTTDLDDAVGTASVMYERERRAIDDDKQPR